MDSSAVKGTNKPSAKAEASEFLTQLPQWLQPGVSPGIHTALRVILLLLNLLLLSCVVLRVLSPHFEIMLLLSIGLSVCYYIFVSQIEEISRQANAVEPSESSSVATTVAEQTSKKDD